MFHRSVNGLIFKTIFKVLNGHENGQLWMENPPFSVLWLF